ncbi:MAG: cation diffusion facilitator family transporter [Firmicutes bacterium]|nr:cation diffusion facilitator family transporter [Bacillota bacterium]
MAHQHAETIDPFVPALVVTGALVLIKVVGAILAHSLALAADAVHSLGDTGALALALYADRQKRRPPTLQFTFGWGRVEVLVALLNALVLWIIAGGLATEAIRDWIHPPTADSGLMLVVAALGMGVNFALLRRVHREHDLNQQATWWHLLSDILSSLSVLVAALVLMLTGWRAANAAATLVIAVLIVVSAWGVIREAVGVLLEATPHDIAVDRLILDMESVPGVHRVHDLHLWAIGSHQWALSCHVSLNEAENVSPQTILCELHDRIQAYGVQHTTIQLETADEGHPEPAW